MAPIDPDHLPHHADLAHDADARAMRKIRDLILQASETHEQRSHDGEPCITNRCNMVAYLAHCLGLNQPHLRHVSRILDTYQAEHVLHHLGPGPGRDGHE